MILYLNDADVVALAIGGGALADAIESALAAESRGAAKNLPKSTIPLADGGLYQATLAAGTGAGAPPYAAVKVVGLSPGNHARALAHIGALVVLLDGATGHPAAIMDAAWITAHRTAAMSLVAARRLARRDAASLGLIACGAQADAHLAAFRDEFPLRRVTAYSRRAETAERFAAAARASGIEARAVTDPAAAVKDHDIVVSSVPAAAGLTPFLSADWLAEGSFAALVDLGRSWREAGFTGFEHRVTDDRAQSEGQTKRKLTPPGPYTGDLKELITGTAPPRRGASERAVFVYQGLALADLAAAAVVYERAKAQGAGTMLAT